MYKIQFDNAFQAQHNKLKLCSQFPQKIIRTLLDPQDEWVSKFLNLSSNIFIGKTADDST